MFGLVLNALFSQEDSFCGVSFKQLILDYMDIVISGPISSVGLLHRRFFMFPLYICLCGQVFGNSCAPRC